MISAFNRKNWNLDINGERQFWKEKLLNIFINVPEACPHCKMGKIHLKNNESIINPVLGKCTNYKCKQELYFRIGSIFEKHNITPASIIYQILDFWLNYDLNGNKICDKLKDLYNHECLNKIFILNILQEFRIYIANYMRDYYCLESIAKKNEWHHVAIDECLFTHQDGIQNWVIGLINTETNIIRLEVVTSRDTETMKNIIHKHVEPGNYIVSDAWPAYNFLDQENNNYIHHVYNHNRGNFGRGYDSTSRIESVWNELKLLFKKIYVTIRSKNFIFFLREIEYRRSIKGLTSKEKLENFATLFNCVGVREKKDYLSEFELISLVYETNFDD